MDQRMSDIITATVRRGTLQPTETGYELTIGTSRLHIGADYGDGATVGEIADWGFTYSVYELELDGETWTLMDSGGGLTTAEAENAINLFTLDSIRMAR